MDSQTTTPKTEDYEIIVMEEYALNAKKKLGSGSSGTVYKGRHLFKDNKVAIKLVTWDDNKTESFRYETMMLLALSCVKRVPKLFKTGRQGNYAIFIMELLGPSLERLMNYCDGKFSLGTTLRISVQILKILRRIHERGIVLRYLKPANMVIGREDKDHIYLIDFSLARKYISCYHHINYQKISRVEGNRWFISLNIHEKIAPSRRDDIECLGYNMVYFMKGKFPWCKCRHRAEVYEVKKSTSLDELCEGLPEEFKEIIQYARNLDFYAEPDYKYLKKLLYKCAEKNGKNRKIPKY